jgi:DNA-directed RNA polymerase subunit M/transcription elongation factor TFIIS
MSSTTTSTTAVAAAVAAESSEVAEEVADVPASSSSSSSSMIQMILNYKEALEKEMMVAKKNDATSDTTSTTNITTIDMERCMDIIQQLQQTHPMTYTILNETLIGVTVNKLKKIVVTSDTNSNSNSNSNSNDNKNDEDIQKLQTMIKGLIKSWKQIVNRSSNNGDGGKDTGGKDTTTATTTAVTKTTTNATSTTNTTAKTISKSSIAIKESKAKLLKTKSNHDDKRRDSLGSSKKKNGKNEVDDDDDDDDDGDDDDDTPTMMIVDPNIAFNHLKETPRISFCQKLYMIFIKHQKALITKEQYHPNVVSTLLYNTCINMEQTMYQQYCNHRRNDKKGYADKARSLLFNLNKNTTLTLSILLGQVMIDDVIQYTAEQLANEQMQLQRQQTQQKLIDSKRLDWNEANEDKINTMCGIKGDLLQASLFTCSRCKSIKTTSTQKQTRSADEPMTVFVLCLNCGKRWKC